ncbi:MAG: hypothetical protein JOZ57_14555, partial [Abitibacteriaceae bacterium]|nr:hypothetical protein [Abditibacteriaceae bacterium]
GNALRYERTDGVLLQSHRDVAVVIGGDALQVWQCGKAGLEWGSNALRDLDDGALNHQDLEIGDVNWACGYYLDLHPDSSDHCHLIFSIGGGTEEALAAYRALKAQSFDELVQRRQKMDKAWLQPGLEALQQATQGKSQANTINGTASPNLIPEELVAAYKRSLLALPLLCGKEGVALAAPEFDPEFISCGGYGYLWPRDGGEYVSGLMDAGYPQFSALFFDWCARHQDASGLWHQRYFLNGEPGPNWCLPPDMLQIDQVGAVLWAFGKWLDALPDGGAEAQAKPEYRNMIRKAADYLMSRLTEKGVHGNAFDTWETFIGSFTYSNAAIYAAFVTAARVLEDAKYDAAARRVKAGVLKHFVRDDYLTRGFHGGGEPDLTVDSASLGAIDPFGLLDLRDEHDLHLAEGTLQAITHRLETDWEGGRAIRRFEGDAYVGGVPACVNTLWMARCCLKVADRLHELGRAEDAATLTQRAQVYLTTVLRRATPTGLLPELMQGPTGQRYWAAPHGWAIASFVSGVLMLARRLSVEKKD